MDVRSNETNETPQNLVWLHGPGAEHLHRPPTQPADGAAGGERQGSGVDAKVIELGGRRRHRAQASLPPPCSGALDGTTGLPIGLLEDPRPMRAAGRREGLEHQGSDAERILVVHPEQAVRERLAAGLRRLGLEVVHACTTLQAVWFLTYDVERISAVLVSNSLHRASGPELLRFAARRHPGLRRILLASAEDGLPANDVDPRAELVVSDDTWEVCALFAERC